MASTNNNAITLHLVLMLSLLLAFSIAEGRLGGFEMSAVGIGKSVPRGPTCDSVYGVQNGDTCLEVAQMFSLTTDFFNSINPNLNCTALFIGQWLCTSGTPN